MSDRRALLERLWAADSDEESFRTGEVAAILRVSVRSVRSWADEGKVASVRTKGGHRLFSASAVREALERMERGEIRA